MSDGLPGNRSGFGLEPLDYHIELLDYLKRQEREVWDWFASARAQEDYTENLRMALLKTTYRLDPDTHPDLYKAVEEAKGQLRLDIPVTVYQAQNSPQPNATLFFIPGEGHIVFSGSALTLLNHEELKSVLGHELAHYHLWQWQQGELHITDRLLHAVANDPRAAASHEQSARRFQLYTEIFADRGSLCVVRDVATVVSGLVKMETGLAQVSGPGYLKQAEEIFSKSAVSTEGLSHPETFIRARALSLWNEQRENSLPAISAMIEGNPVLDELDLLGQQRLQLNTRTLLEHLLQPKWFQTPAVLGHAKLFFHDFAPVAAFDPSPLERLKFHETKLQEYACYLLLDFVTADPELEHLPLAAALNLSQKLEFDAAFEKVVARELKMKIREVRKLKDNCAEMLANAEAAE